jgi:hypothetical protein
MRRSGPLVVAGAFGRSQNAVGSRNLPSLAFNSLNANTNKTNTNIQSLIRGNSFNKCGEFLCFF